MEINATPGSILRHGFKSFFGHWWQLLLATIITLLPALIITISSQRIMSFSATGVFTILSMLFYLVFLIVVALIARNTIIYNSKTTLKDMWVLIRKKYLPLLITVLLLGLFVIGAVIAAAIPIALVGLLFYGLYLLVVASNIATVIITVLGSVIILLLLIAAFAIIITHVMFTPYVVLFEEKNYLAAIKHAFHMVRGRFWNVLGNWIVVMLVSIGLTLVLTLIMLPLIMAFQESVTVSLVLTVLQQYVSVPTMMALVALFFVTNKNYLATTLHHAKKKTVKTSAKNKVASHEVTHSKGHNTASHKKKSSKKKATTHSKKSSSKTKK